MVRCWDKRAALHLKRTELLCKPPHCVRGSAGPGHAGQDLLEQRHPAQHRACSLHYQSHLSVRPPLRCVCLCRYSACAAVGGSGTLLEWPVNRVQHLTPRCASHQHQNSRPKRSGRDPSPALSAVAKVVGCRQPLARHLDIGPCIRKPCQITEVY